MTLHSRTSPRADRARLVALLFAVLAAGGLFAACSAGAEGEEGGADEVLARVQGDPVTRAEVEDAASEDLENVEQQLEQCRMEAEQQRHDVLEEQTRQLVRERLLQAEAESRGLTEAELLDAEVESRIPEVTPEEVDAFYQQNRARLGQASKEQVTPQIEQYLAQQRRSEVYEEFIGGLEEEHGVAYEIGPYRLDVNVASEPADGPEDAPVTIVEFSDFECPYCSRLVPTLERVKEEYGDRVRLVFKQFPLRNIHPNAQKAAEASLCAHDQGEFWAMHDAMFDDQQDLGVDALKAKAEEIGLDTATFAECLDSDRYADAVEEDLQEGQRVGVSGTPAMFVNGRMVSGAVPYEQVARVIDEELEGT